MGCSASKLEDEEAVKLCKDRRNFIKQAVELRTQFASGHIAYLQSLKRVSLALHNFVDGGECHDFLLDSYTTPPFTPTKRLTPEIIGIPPLKSLTPTPTQSEKSTTVHAMRYLRSNANPSISVEEVPQSSETVRLINSYYPSSTYGVNGYFAMEAPQLNNHSSSFFPSPYDNRPSYPPPSPQNSQRDLFWNPFTAWDSYVYPSRVTPDDEMASLRQVREEEGIPELEEDNDDEEAGCIGEGEEEEEEEEEDTVGDFIEVELKEKRDRVGHSRPKASVPTGDVREPTNHVKSDTLLELKGLHSQSVGSIEVAKEPKVVDLEVNRSKQEVVGKREGAKEETPGFTVYVNRRHRSMREIMKEIENQFARICDCAHEVSVMLEASRAQLSSNSSELTAIRMLNPVALFHSASSRSTSSRFFLASSSSRELAYDSSSDNSEESSMISGSHQSTLDRLYAWEKRLYQEVKSGERIRVAYEKKCKQLHNQDVNGEEPSSVFKTRAAIRDLYTKLKVSIHTVESISKRIEALRDEELHPQLMELIHGLARMWRTMGDSHRIQKHAMDDAKFLLIMSSTSSFPSFPTAAKQSDFSSPPKPPRSATNLESELRNWRSAFVNWTTSIRSYALALSSWAHRCCSADPTSTEMMMMNIPAFDVCSQWAQLLMDQSLGGGGGEGAQVLDGLDFFAAGIGSVYSVGIEEGEREIGEEKKTAELGGRVLCAGMSVAVGKLTEFAVRSAEGYEELLLCLEGGRRRTRSVLM